MRVDPLFQEEIRRFNEELVRNRVLEDRNIRAATRKLAEIMQQADFVFLPGEINVRKKRRGLI